MATVSDKRILLTGATGFLGRNLHEVLAKAKYFNVIPVCSKDYNLLEESQVRKMFQDHKPEVVIHLAALSGGIKANLERPADFFYQNIHMQTMVMHEACKTGVEKYLTCIGGCSYPAHAPSPIKEEEMWNGYPQPESAGYSVAKKMNIVQAQTYRKQYRFNAVVTVPGNMYGPYDNFNLNDAHVIPAIIRKIYEAKLRSDKEVLAWGTGKPVRDFVHVKDVAHALIAALEMYDGDQFFNISSGMHITIRDLCTTVAELIGFSGAIVWDTSKPDGQLFKGFDVSLMKKLIHFECTTSLREGLKQTIEWFVQNYHIHGAVRL